MMNKKAPGSDGSHIPPPPRVSAETPFSLPLEGYMARADKQMRPQGVISVPSSQYIEHSDKTA